MWKAGIYDLFKIVGGGSSRPNLNLCSSTLLKLISKPSPVYSVAHFVLWFYKVPNLILKVLYFFICCSQMNYYHQFHLWMICNFMCLSCFINKFRCFIFPASIFSTTLSRTRILNFIHGIFFLLKSFPFLFCVKVLFPVKSKLDWMTLLLWVLITETCKCSRLLAISHWCSCKYLLCTLQSLAGSTWIYVQLCDTWKEIDYWYHDSLNRMNFEMLILVILFLFALATQRKSNIFLQVLRQPMERFHLLTIHQLQKSSN